VAGKAGGIGEVHRKPGYSGNQEEQASQETEITGTQGNQHHRTSQETGKNKVLRKSQKTRVLRKPGSQGISGNQEHQAFSGNRDHRSRQGQRETRRADRDPPKRALPQENGRRSHTQDAVPQPADGVRAGKMGTGRRARSRHRDQKKPPEAVHRPRTARKEVMPMPQPFSAEAALLYAR
jgi:hypothetical protein